MINPCKELLEEVTIYKIFNRNTDKFVAVYAMDREGELEFKSVQDARNCFASGRFLDEKKYGIVPMVRYSYAEEKRYEDDERL